MTIVVTGSLGHIGRPLTEILVKKGHEVTVVSSKPDRVAEIEALGARAAIGSVEDAEFLKGVFTGADLAYTMIPPGDFRNQDYDVYERVGALMNTYRQALADAGVKRVIHLSSIGAHTDKGNGLLRLHFIAETILKELPDDVHLTFMRPTGFFYNLLGFIPLIKSQGMIAANYGGDDVASWVAPADIATAIAEEIDNPTVANRSFRYVASDELSCNEVARILGAAIGKPGLTWIKISDDQMLQGLLAAGMKPDIAEGYVEMYARQGLYEDYYRHHPTLGKTKLAAFAPEFAAAYHRQ
ncbi:MAG TPA: NmrA family NAD(P)-binding protein [Dinghuibacter sp.]|uniref:NmrA family NAD(P)-binding protein n=1 Tax=Dinghuibacter sp. TaxID=2024697 RepID=UPI002C418794|nr:NmrA family NAD(P)-binding protein [Dinghuibacter sp.]HTJ11941.1 NmrA family NAD(P)-binding protein [Dinghuibacter sp.]